MLDPRNLNLTDDPLKNIRAMAPYLSKLDQIKTACFIAGLKTGERDPDHGLHREPEKKTGQEGGGEMRQTNEKKRLKVAEALQWIAIVISIIALVKN